MSPKLPGALFGEKIRYLDFAGSKLDSQVASYDLED